MPELSRMSGFFIILAWTATYLPLKIDRSLPRIFATGVILFSIILLPSESHSILGLGLYIFAVGILSENEDQPKNNDTHVFLLAIVLYTAFSALCKFSPDVWYFLKYLSLNFSSVASSIVGNKMTLGSSALGIPVTASFLCYIISLLLFYRRKTVFVLLSLLAPIGANVIFLSLQSPLTGLVQIYNKGLEPTPIDFSAVLLFLLIAAICPISRKAEFGKFPVGLTGNRLKYAIAAMVFVFIGFAVLSFRGEGTGKQGGVLFCDRGSNWDVPYYGKQYGQHSTGMFGILPNYLLMRGYQARIWRGAITEKILRNTAVLVVFNPVKLFSGLEKQVIYNFIGKGGSLLCAGDHTDVTGVMNPINDLLLPFNIHLNFDTALPIRSGWVHSLEKRPHPITKVIKEDYDTAIWVGASLSIALPAKPVIIGKRGWADTGNYENTKRAFLGNYRRSPDEQLGDIVLAAEAPYGKGKVLVFGDTSTFQNGVLLNSYLFIDEIFDWLSRDSDRYYATLQLIVALGALFVTGLVLRRIPCSLLFMGFILLAHAALWGTSQAGAIKSELVNVRSKTTESAFYEPAYIDASHLGRFSFFSAQDNSVWGFSISLMRNSYIPMYMNEFSVSTLSETSLFTVIAPTIEFSKRETEALKDFMQNGGKVIWSVGWEEAEASKSFLKEFGLSIDAIPLGPAEVEIEKRKVKFLEAWAVIGGTESKQIIAEAYGYPIVVYQPVGKGGIFLIGDSRFLHSRNIESYKDQNMYNIWFIKYLLKMIKA